MSDKIKGIMFDIDPDKDIMVTYPELRGVEEFKKLSSQQMKFVWAYRCSSFNNDFKDISDKERLGQAYEYAFGKENTPQKQKYLAYTMPEPVKIAYERMAQFSPTARMRAAGMINKMFQTFESLVDAKPSDFKDEDGNINITAYNTYINACSKVSEVLPRLIEQIESGFGMSSKEESVTFKPQKAIDRFHDNK